MIRNATTWSFSHVKVNRQILGHFTPKTTSCNFSVNLTPNIKCLHASLRRQSHSSTIMAHQQRNQQWTTPRDAGRLNYIITSHGVGQCRLNAQTFSSTNCVYSLHFAIVAFYCAKLKQKVWTFCVVSHQNHADYNTLK